MLGWVLHPTYINARGFFLLYFLPHLSHISQSSFSCITQHIDFPFAQIIISLLSSLILLQISKVVCYILGVCLILLHRFFFFFFVILGIFENSWFFGLFYFLKLNFPRKRISEWKFSRFSHLMYVLFLLFFSACEGENEGKCPCVNFFTLILFFVKKVKWKMKEYFSFYYK